MYNIIFYEDKDGNSELYNFIQLLIERTKNNDKNARIQLKQIRTHIGYLEQKGTRAGDKYVKHIQGDIWEIRPCDNRVLFFVWVDNNIVLLNYFRKKTQKTPQREIAKAVRMSKDWEERIDKNEKMD